MTKPLKAAAKRLSFKTNGFQIAWKSDLSVDDPRFRAVRDWAQEGIRRNVFVGLLPIEMEILFKDNPPLYD